MFKFLKVTRVDNNSDVVCYKRFSRSAAGNLSTPYQKHPWPKDTTTMSVQQFGTRINVMGYLEISEGLHAYVTKANAKSHMRGDEVVREMIIPAGTQYLIDTTGKEIVALKMRLKNC